MRSPSTCFDIYSCIHLMSPFFIELGGLLHALCQTFHWIHICVPLNGILYILIATFQACTCIRYSYFIHTFHRATISFTRSFICSVVHSLIQSFRILKMSWKYSSAFNSFVSKLVVSVSCIYKLCDAVALKIDHNYINSTAAAPTSHC